MDFFESQDRARKRSGRLIFLYLLAVAGIVASVYFVVLFAADFAGVTPEREQLLWDPMIFAVSAGSTLGIIVLGSAYRILQLRSGGARVAEMMGGRSVNLATTDPLERRLINVVEEMALASGVPVPEIFIMDSEAGINAFAAGYTTSDAAVAVTRGALELLDRDELQGVIAHEFSHILNGDMRLNIRLIGVLNGILILHLIGMIFFRVVGFGRYRGSSYGGGRGGGGRGKGEGGGAGAIIIAIIIVALALMIIGYIGVLFSRLIQAAVSRQREYLADAAAVQFTRNPDGIANALKKIGGTRFGSKLHAAHTMEMSHLFFANGIASSLSNVFSTHPPLVKRICAIDPSFDGKSWIRTKKPSAPEPKSKFPKSRRMPETATRQASPWGGLPTGGALAPEVLLATIGVIGASQLSQAEKILDVLPESLTSAIREPAGAQAAIYALLLSKEPETQQKELSLLGREAPAGVRAEVEKLSADAADLPPEARLPLVDLALPALRRLSPEQFAAFRQTVRRLSESDNEFTLFEFALEKVLLRHLERHFESSKPPTVQYYAASGLAPECSVLLSALAYAGGKDAPKAFAAGQSYLPDVDLQLEPAEACSYDRIYSALDRCNLASLPVKKKILHAAIAVIVADQKIAATEAELLRAIAASLDCPMPPLQAAPVANLKYKI